MCACACILAFVRARFVRAFEREFVCAHAFDRACLCVFAHLSVCGCVFGVSAYRFVEMIAV